MSERKLLYLEPVGGIAGDMFLAAAVDLGVSLDALAQGLESLKVEGWRFAAARAERMGIVGTHLDVEVEGDSAHQARHDQHHSQDHSHREPVLERHHDPQPGSVAHSHSPHRSLSEIQALIGSASGLPERARNRALAAFQALGEAEARVHGVPVEAVHFHEVGAVDAMVDICGAALALELLGDPEVFCAPPPLGGGFVRAAHGRLPVPAPATLELLRGLPVRNEGEGELTTPTGAALVRTLCQVGAPPEWVVERVGYGVGTKEWSDRPNVLRASLGRRAHADAALWVVEANLDDCSPQLLARLIELALERGAVDAWVVPATMKKGRPGHLFSAVVPLELRAPLVEAIVTESTTLGARFHPVERFALERRIERVRTRFGELEVKLGLFNGTVVNVQPEYEDCRRAAQQHRVALKQVMAEVVAQYFNQERSDG